MDQSRLSAWWFDRLVVKPSQTKTPGEALAASGWARSVGGANPYLSIFSRNGCPREAIETAYRNLEIHELPSARGCTYQLPSEDFGLGLSAGASFQSEVSIAEKHFGFTANDLDKLCHEALQVINDQPQDPATIKKQLGDKVRNFGEEGKKRGLTTSLPMALGRLQSQAEIRRVPKDGRLDQQSFGYVRWTDHRPTLVPPDAALEKLAQRYWEWVGIARLEDFKWFSSAGVNAIKQALQGLDLQPIEDGSPFLASPHAATEFKDFTPTTGHVALLSGLDSLFLLRRDFLSFMPAEVASIEVLSDKKMAAGGGLADLTANVVVKDARIIGYWEFDPAAGELVEALFEKPDAKVTQKIEEMESFIREELGDCRSFSLDSPASRQPALARLRELQAQHYRRA
ncbi:MAG: winged helix DNA-binding domain-containing protein [Armatimonadetes bacterium]|nr:winged helix DNA-binding domain-containing protein [Armatimonadota bacterium]